MSQSEAARLLARMLGIEACRDHVRDRLGIARDIWKRERAPAPIKREDDDRAQAQWLWGRRKSIAGTIAEIYLRERADITA